jgi:RNA polymerase sigma factor (sigma-70 family)
MTVEVLREADLDAFLNAHGDRVYTYLCVLCRNEDHASDAMQNAYVKFLEQVRRGNVRKGTAVQYLQTIAKNDYFTRVKKEQKEDILPEDVADTRLERNRSRDEAARLLRLILLETVEDPDVPPDVARVVRLRFLEEADLPAMCEATGKSQATVYRLLENGLTILAEACRKAGLHVEDLGV